MKRQIIFLLLMLFASVLAAQDKRKSLLSIHLGAAFPMGDYSSTSVTKDDAGFAETGFSGSLKFTKMFGGTFGICVATHSEINSFNTSELQKAYQQETPGVSYSIDADSWKTGSLLVGVTYQTPMETPAKNFFELSVMLGYMNTTFPSINMNLYSSSGQGWVRFDEHSAEALAFVFSAGVYLGVSEKILIPITLDYMSGTPHFDSFTIYSSGGNYVSNPFDQPVSNLNLMTGIVFLLN